MNMLGELFAYPMTIQLDQLMIGATNHPMYLMIFLVLLCLLFEDMAIAAGVSCATAGSLSWEASFFAVWLGIAGGDLLLYGMGYLARNFSFFKRKCSKHILLNRDAGQKVSLASKVFISRAIPGLRLIGYVYMGFSKTNFYNFAILVGISVFVWTLTLYIGSVFFGEHISRVLNLPISIASAIPLLLVCALSLLFPYIKNVLCKGRSPNEL